MPNRYYRLTIDIEVDKGRLDGRSFRELKGDLVSAIMSPDPIRYSSSPIRCAGLQSAERISFKKFMNRS